MAFDEIIVQAVWEKGKTVGGYNPAKWRKDACAPSRAAFDPAAEPIAACR